MAKRTLCEMQRDESGEYYMFETIRIARSSLRANEMMIMTTPSTYPPRIDYELKAKSIKDQRSDNRVQRSTRIR